MAAATEMPLNLETTINFVKLTASKFSWGDLSDDVVMDIGCGKELYCSRTILDNFPKVKSIIAVDDDPKEIKGMTFRAAQIEPFFADISKRDAIHSYEGKIDKAISTHVIHQIPNKQKVFKNVYRLLKPGGQAAFLFTSDLGLYHVLEYLRSNSEYKDYYKKSDIVDLYSSTLKAHHYRDMLEKIGFRVVEITDEQQNFSSSHFGKFEKTVNKVVGEAFSPPPELAVKINNSASNFYRRKFCIKDSVYSSTEMSIFVTKASDSTTGCSSF